MNQSSFLWKFDLVNEDHTRKLKKKAKDIMRVLLSLLESLLVCQNNFGRLRKNFPTSLFHANATKSPFFLTKSEIT